MPFPKLDHSPFRWCCKSLPQVGDQRICLPIPSTEGTGVLASKAIRTAVPTPRKQNSGLEISLLILQGEH